MPASRGCRSSRIHSIVEEANRLGGDIILLLGDFAAGLGRFKLGPVPAKEWSRALAGLSAPLGVHAIPGNHDWWTNLAEVMDALDAAGIPVFQNRAQKFTSPAPFWLAGTDSIVAHRSAAAISAAQPICRERFRRSPTMRRPS